MAHSDLSDKISPGMVVLSADGKRLGTLTRLHEHEDQTVLEVTPRGSRWKLWTPQIERLFLPPSTVASVTQRTVSITLDARTANGYRARPRWLPPDKVFATGTGLDVHYDIEK